MREPVGLRKRGNPPTRKPETWTPDLLEKVAWRVKAADEPFRGVATSEGITPGLFPLRTTGADVSKVNLAAENYLAGLSEQQLAEGRFPMDDVSWRHWNNGARYFLRHGLLLEDFDDAGRERALAVVRESLSADGYRQTVDLMRLNLTIGEMSDNTDGLNEWLYWFSLYGEPENGGPWGWQLDGHHVNINCVFVGDQMVLTPAFLGAEPVIAGSGKYAGTVAFRGEEALGHELFTRLDGRQRERAVIADEMPRELLVGAFRDNWELDYQGLRLAEMSSGQRETALRLLELYVNRAGDQHARVRMAEVLAHEGDTRFGWAGDPDGTFYYRFHSPVILVEFEHMAGVLFDNDYPSRRHIHTVVRTPNGNDFGVDLLRQHRERHHEPHNKRSGK
ncbi:DUF3500 domain-containing protein [Streptomyces sp. NBC_01239]|uniref:DUF3500 domain-containing protein n=1 Tax=Streptomyces sp. NBC_01239 TaxID=2903792 RepID=UPI00224CF795|nr:DUF3500 domain-containing protein [Streptomyces sp. NBC_01239]MCX4816533.1 DUF3500 domain-containing protein [Streptomyces sp. NBC_01239]